MQNRHERRRRVLSDESPSGVTAKDKKRSGSRRSYAPAARREQQARLTDFVPMRYRTLSLLALLALSAVAGLVFLHTRIATIADLLPEADLSALDLGSPRSLASCFSVAAAMLCGLVSLVIYSLRRYRIDDYHGRYRLWLWCSLLWMIAAVQQMTGAFGLVSAVVARYTRQFHLLGPDPALALCGVLTVLLLVQMVLEVRRSVGATALLLTGAALIAASVALKSGLLVAGNLEARVMLVAGGRMLGNLVMLFGVGTYARRVILEAEGLISTRKKKKRRKSDSSPKLATAPGGSQSNNSRTAAASSAGKPGDPGSNGPQRTGLSPAAQNGAQSASADDDDDDEQDDREEFHGLSRAERKRLRRERKQEQRRAA